MGRKRKKGDNHKRTKSGQLSRAGMRVLPNERAQAMQALYGIDGCDAIGRAYRCGLLGEGSDAKALLDTARRISNAYWQAYSVGTIGCTLGDRTGGGLPIIDGAKAKAREEWLSECMDTVNAMGRSERRCFDQLVIDVNPDHGPDWLDRLCFAMRTTTMVFEQQDANRLRLALERLAVLAEVEAPALPFRKAA